MDHTHFFSIIQSNSLTGSYLLHGKEEFVKDSALKAILDAVDRAAFDMNVQYFEEAEPTMLTEACESLPFLADKRIVICKSLPKSDAAKRIMSYLPTMPDSTLLIFFIRGKADEKLEIVKQFKKSNTEVLFDALTEHDAMRFIASTAKKLDATISPNAASRLLALVGTDVSYLNNELTKAANYAGVGNEITNEIISKTVTPNIEYRIFDMLDSFFAGKIADGLRALTALERDGEAAISVSSLIESRIKAMLAARKLIDRGLNRDKAIKLIGGHPFAAGKAYDAAKRFSRAQLTQALIEFANVSHLKISGALDDKDALISAIIKNFGIK